MQPPSPYQAPLPLLPRQRIGPWFRSRRRLTRIGLGFGVRVVVLLLCTGTLAVYGSTPPQAPAAISGPQVTRTTASTTALTIAPILQTTAVPTLAPTPTLIPTSTPTPTPKPSIPKVKSSIPTPKPTAIASAAPAGSSQQIYWGAAISGTTYGPNYRNPPWDRNTWDLFESHTGKKISILHWGFPWYSSVSWPQGYHPFDSSLLDTTRSRGAIPLIDWASSDSDTSVASQPAFALRNIVNGASYTFGGQTFDSYVTQWAQAAKAWGHPFFLRFDWEMNGWWQFPWATAPDPTSGNTINNNTPQDYVNAWRHVHDIFTKVGATNVSWVWCPNISSDGTIPLSQLYPGDAYVDWVCLDGYNKDPNHWVTFAQVYSGSLYNGYHNSYNEITSVAPGKPLMIGELASIEAGDGGAKKAAWITDALQTQLPRNYPKIKAVVWFNWNADPGSTYVIESSAQAKSAFASSIASSYYATNNFRTLNTSPIPPI